MLPISESDKHRLLSFIDENQLDYTPVDGGISKFHINADDGMAFFFYTYNESYVVVRYDKDKEKPGSQPYEYFYFQNLTQILEQISLYDNNIPKRYWYPTTNSIEVPFDRSSYTDDWLLEFMSDDFYSIEENGEYKYLIYDNPNYKPELISPFNTLHEVSLFNYKTFTKVDKLSFQIHPISCQKGSESYFVKILSNNEEVLKEYINYRVAKKKGLVLLVEGIFNEMEKFKRSSFYTKVEVGVGQYLSIGDNEFSLRKIEPFTKDEIKSIEDVTGLKFNKEFNIGKISLYGPGSVFVSVNIIKRIDEWYLLEYDRGDVDHPDYYKCDQLEGLLTCLRDIFTSET